MLTSQLRYGCPSKLTLSCIQALELNSISRDVEVTDMKLQGSKEANLECGTCYKPADPVSEQVTGTGEKGVGGTAVDERGKGDLSSDVLGGMGPDSQKPTGK